ncbi:NADH-quinone oxidoreductase subunit NuoE [Pelagibacteraceae bacterium]|nr:NADH-quinone oxidoreductase subunit NuoE [Pelagibacteraceae bacterium]
MSGKHVAKNQPSSFEFSNENKIKIDEILKKYPDSKKKSAVMPLLYIAQRQNNNWIPLAAIQLIADMLEVAYIKVYEVATFYTMYNLAPVGKYFVQVCTTTPCMIRGSGKVVEMCKKHISEKQGHVNKELDSSWIEVECLGACVNAPMVQINEDYYEDLNAEKAEKIFNSFKEGTLPKIGSQSGRRGSEPIQNRTTLLNKNA